MRRILLAFVLLSTFPAQAAELKLSTWNLSWLTLRSPDDPVLPRHLARRQPGDWRLLAQYAQRLAADIVAFQEVDGAEAAERIFPAADYALFLARENDVQRTGFAIRRHLRATQNEDLAGLDLNPHATRSLRRGTDVTVEWGGMRLRLLSIHLKAGCREDPLSASQRPECGEVARQAAVLAEWTATRRAEGAPFAILGDFNRRMDRGDELLDTMRRAAPLIRTTEGVSNPCWTDGRGGRPFIDHILLSEAAARLLEPGSLRVLVYAERDPALRNRLSDHCPVSIRLRKP
jgi:endonuclease/exonuclease/phosphatase family metal-dependent hydrolase